MVARADRPARRLAVRWLDDAAADLLATRPRWQVHSVFDRALNLASDAGDLLAIVAAGHGNGPATLVLAPTLADAASPWPASPFEGIRPGAAALASPAEVAIDGRLRFDLANAARWRPHPARRVLGVDEVGERVRRAAAAALRPADAAADVPSTPTRPVPPGLGGLLPEAAGVTALGPPDPARCIAAPVGWTARARDALHRLQAAAERADWQVAADAARSLSGLGPGLTPSGDDLLAGLALGWRAAAGALPEPLGRLLVAAVADRTTDLAAARVRHAVAGRPDEASYAVLIALLAAADRSAVDVGVARLAAVGHSTGVDTLVGLLLGVRLGLRQ